MIYPDDQTGQRLTNLSVKKHAKTKYRTIQSPTVKIRSKY